MKWMKRNSVLLFCLLFCLFLGIHFSFDLDKNFIPLYFGKASSISFRYSILSIILIINCFLYKNLIRYTFLFRFSSIDEFFIKIKMKEIINIIIVVLFINIPSLFMYFSYFISNISKLFANSICIVFTCLFINSTARLISLINKNIIKSSVIFLAFFGFVDFIIEHLFFTYFLENFFDFSCIFSIPFSIKIWPSVIIIILVLTIIFDLIYINYVKKTDFFLGDEKNEKV